MKQRLKITTLLLLISVVVGCSKYEDCVEKGNSIYYWKTTFDVDSSEILFLEKHKINRIYLRMFDVAVQEDILGEGKEIEPIATTKFLSPIPQNVAIVPVTYITLDALSRMGDRVDEYADLIVARLMAMCNYNRCGEIKEVQLDCDWTAATRHYYHALCQRVKGVLNEKGIELSITVRLHQLREMPPPADKGVLMLYNTGALKKPSTINSILDIDDVKPYLKRKKYWLPLAYAYPCFGWGVKFKGEKFVSIVSENSVCGEGETIRVERAKGADICKVKDLVESRLGKPKCGNILYHLDILQLNNYSDDEIEEILAD